MRARVEAVGSRSVVRTRRIRSVSRVEQDKLLLVRRSCYITSSECSGECGRKCSGKAVEEAKMQAWS
jgi:hypothetical protein